MKALFINPPALNLEKQTREGRCTQSSSFWSLTYPPLSLAQIAAEISDLTAEQYGFDFSVQGVSQDQALLKLDNIHADIAVISLGTPTVRGDLLFCKKLKMYKPSIKIILIGTHSSFYSKEILELHPKIDFVIHGEPERPIIELVKSILRPQIDQETIKGISYIHNNELYENKELHLNTNLSQSKIPRWDLFDLNNYRLPLRGRKFLLISPQRGCPWKCSFCTAPLYSGQSIRTRTIDSIISEIKYLKATYNISDFLFWSDTFTANKQFVLELCEQLIPLNINWVSNSRIDTIDQELAHKMYLSGCWILTFGIESNNDKTLLEIKKGFTHKEIEKGFNAVKSSNILTIAHIIAGLPGESPRDFINSYKVLSQMGFDFIQPYLASPFPGTALFRQLKSSRKEIDVYEEYSQEKTHTQNIEWQKTFNNIKLKCFFRVKSIVFLILCAVKSSYVFRRNKNY